MSSQDRVRRVMDRIREDDEAALQRQCELIAAILRGDYDHDDGLDDDDDKGGAR